MKTILKTSFSFLQGGGEMGELTRSYNWSQTSIGNPDGWPQSLRTTLSILLNSKFPMFLFWGAELICFYNDAYRPSLGNEGKHPYALGKPGGEIWPEIWPDIKPLIDQVLAGGEATWSEDQLLPIYRNGKLEDVYWTFSYSPVADETGRPAGVFVTCSETTDKVINMKALQDHKDQLQFAIEAAGLGVWDLNPLTNRFTANERLKEWFGLQPDDEIELATAINIIADKDRPAVMAVIEKAMDYSYGGGYDIEYAIVHPVTNLERIVHAKGQAWFRDDKVAYRFNGTLQDITEQTIARKKIEESEQRFRNLVEQTPIAAALLEGKDMVVRVANDAVLAIWGRNRSVLGKPLLEIMPEIIDQPFPKLLDSVFTTGVTYTSGDDLVRLNKGGRMEDMYLAFTYKALYYTNEEIGGVLITALDVTEKVLAQKRTEESELNLRNTILQSPVAISIFKGPEYVVEIANKRMLELWGKNSEEILQRPIFEGLPEAKGQGLEDLLLHVYTTGETFSATERLVMLPREGRIETVYINFVYEPFREIDGKITGIIAVANEVTEQVLIRQKIEEAEERARLSIDAAELGTFELNIVTDRLLTSARFNSLFDVGPLGEHADYLNVIHPDDLKIREEAFSDALQSGVLEYEVRVVWKDGSLHWLRAKGIVSFDAYHQPVKLLGVIQDITEEKAFFEELEKQVQQRTIQLQR